jgi:hypothetical protein
MSLAVTLLADRPVRQPTLSQMCGRWIGYERVYPEFYALTLRDTKSGTLVMLQPEATVYRISWNITNRLLVLEAKAASTNTEEITLRVDHFDQQKISLIISGVTNEWRHQTLLLNELELNKRIAETAKYTNE